MKKIFSLMVLIGLLVSVSCFAKTFAVTQDCNLREGPSTKTKVLTTIPFGASIKSNETENGWYKTTYMNKTGWVSSSCLMATNLELFNNPHLGPLPFIIIAMIISGLGVGVWYSKKRKFLNEHKIKCSVCGSTNTRFISMTTKSHTSGSSHKIYNVNSGYDSSYTTTHYGHDKFYCAKCNKDYYIERGDWVNSVGYLCNSQAKKYGLYK